MAGKRSGSGTAEERRPKPAAGAAASLPLAGGREELGRLLGAFLARQDWAQSALGVFGSHEIAAEVADVEVLDGKGSGPGLASVLVEAGSEKTVFHVLVGWRPVAEATAALLRPDAVISAGEGSEGPALLYEALADAELRVRLLEAATGGAESARSARVVHSLASHAALVYDDRLFMKCYRVIEPGVRPELEVYSALAGVGFEHLLATVARWSRGTSDLGLVRRFLPGAVEGRALALTSLRDVLARAAPGEPPRSFEEIGLAGGDLGYEMQRLGATTAELHLAMREAFGTTAGPEGDPLIRLHGDYHLRRVMRSDTGWVVAGFGDDPLIGREAGAPSQGEARFGPPLEDMADLVASLAQVAGEAASFQPAGTSAQTRPLAEGWVAHNRKELLRGYLAVDGIDGLVRRPQIEIDSWLDAAVPPRLARSRSAEPAAQYV